MKPHRIAIIGFGKIAQDQHRPVIAGNPAFELAAIASQRGVGPSDVPAFQDYRKMLAKAPEMRPFAAGTASMCDAMVAGRSVPND